MGKRIMTAENFYILIGGNYEKIIQNLKDDKNPQWMPGIMRPDLQRLTS